MKNNLIVRFVLVFVLSFGINYSLYILFSGIYTGAIKSAADFLISRNILDDYSQVTEIKIESKEDNLFFLFRHRETNNKLQTVFAFSYVTVNLRSHGFVPTALLLSFIIASPVTFRRKRFALFIAIVSMNIYILVKLNILISDHLFNYWVNKLPNLTYSLKTEFVSIINTLINTQAPTGSAMAIVIMLWVLLTFRQEDLKEVKSKLIENKKR